MAVYSVLDEASALASLPGDVDGYVSICGYGSLLSEKSARSTFPNLINFRAARLTGFRRLFSVVGPVFFTHGVANLKTHVRKLLPSLLNLVKINVNGGDLTMKLHVE